MKAWQRGFALPALQAWARLFDEFSGPFCLGPFTKINESQAASLLAEGKLEGDADTWAVAGMRVAGQRLVKDFSGELRVRAPAGSLMVKRVAWRGPEGRREVARRLGASRPLVWEAFAEHDAETELAEELGLERLGAKIRASSEVFALWGAGAARFDYSSFDRVDALTIAPLGVPRFSVGELAAQVDAVASEFVDHYSSYNARKSWAAMALRSFGGAPDFIEKPAEMSKRWKAEHREALAWKAQDTPLREKLPAAEPIIGALPGAKQRIRIMRLAPGGELRRHADITDREAGCRDGQIMRIHVPLQTSPACQFRGWGLDGEARSYRMGEGEAWYLDTRKPHAATNGGAEPRVHLVIDSVASAGLRRLLL